MTETRNAILTFAEIGTASGSLNCCRDLNGLFEISKVTHILVSPEMVNDNIIFKQAGAYIRHTRCIHTEYTPRLRTKAVKVGKIPSPDSFHLSRSATDGQVFADFQHHYFLQQCNIFGRRTAMPWSRLPYF